MMKLSFHNMTPELNIFNLQRQPDGFDNLDHSTLNWVGRFSYDGLEFEHVDAFDIVYESFLTNDELEYDVFNFNDAYSMDFITEITSACDTSTIPLDFKPLLDFLKYQFLGHDHCL